MIHNFTGIADGGLPYSGLILDAKGNLYGTAAIGGGGRCFRFIKGCGVVFELSKSTNGNWNETVLHPFAGGDGNWPDGPLVFDAAGNLYGTTFEGGGDLKDCPLTACGGVYKLSPSSGGTWTETLLYSFHGSDGAFPESGFVLDAAGNLYGTTAGGGIHAPGGTVFEISP